MFNILSEGEVRNRGINVEYTALLSVNSHFEDAHTFSLVKVKTHDRWGDEKNVGDWFWDKFKDQIIAQIDEQELGNEIATDLYLKARGA